MQKILITSHDAGGAEIISSWVKYNPQNEYKYILEGPALNIFLRKIPNIINHDRNTLKMNILESDLVLTGTSWNSTLENEAIHCSLENKIKVVSYIEHWVNYLERFQFNGTTELPNEIWVGDTEALKIANTIFPNDKVKFIPNCYFLDMKNEITNYSKSNISNKLRILYLCEPIAKAALWRYGNPYHFGFTEDEAIQYFFTCLDNSITSDVIEQITIRPHPSEEKNKYELVLKKYNNYPTQLSYNNTLAEDCGIADLIVGCTSNALVACLQANKKVFSCIPVPNPIYKLPFDGIKDFKTWTNAALCQN